MKAFELTAAYPAQAGAPSSYYQMDLLVMASRDKITAAQFNTSQDQLISLFEYSCPDGNPLEEKSMALEQLLEEEPLFKKPYRKEIIAFEHPFSCLIPGDIYDKNQAREYLSLLFVLPEEQVFLGDEVKTEGLVNVFSLPERGYNAVLSKYPSGHIRHAATALLTGCKNELRSFPDGEAVFCHLHGNIFDLVIYRTGRLLYYNSFQYSNKEEFVYYILFVFEQLSINPQGQDILLLGETDHGSELTSFLESFTGRVSGFKGLLQDMDNLAGGSPDPGRYFSLLNLRLCG